MRLEPTGTPERQYTWTVDHLNVYKQKILSIFPILGHLGDFLELKSSPKPVRSLDYIDRTDSNRQTVSRRDKILAAARASISECVTACFLRYYRFRTGRGVIDGLSDLHFTSEIPRLYRPSRLEPTDVS